MFLKLFEQKGVVQQLHMLAEVLVSNYSSDILNSTLSFLQN